MKTFLKTPRGLCALVGILSLLMFGALRVSADLGDRWTAPDGTLSGNSWRIPSTNELLPGTTNVYDIGSLTYYPKTIFQKSQNFIPQTLTTNATLTVANGSMWFIDCSGGNRTWALPTAAAAGNGFTIHWQSKGTLDATHTAAFNVTSAGNVNSLANVSYASGVAGGTIHSNGTAWFAHGGP